VETLICIKATLGAKAERQIRTYTCDVNGKNGMKILSLLALITALGLNDTTSAWAAGNHSGGHDHGDEHKSDITRLLMSVVSSARGMELFVEKGCVACHAVSGVGGHDAAALDAHDLDEFVNPFDLVAKMWMMAPSMIAAQEEAFGGQILFTGNELSDIIAFLQDDVQQQQFTEHNLTEEAIVMMDHEHGALAAVEEHTEVAGHSDSEHAHD